MSFQLVLVDDNDKEIGFGTYDECHKGRGVHHRAFVTLVIDSENRVLLQRRKHKLFDGYWDFTAVSHPFHFEDGKQESLEQASSRALEKEMGIEATDVKNLGAFNYFAKDGRYSENEYCHVLVGIYDGEHKFNINEVYETKKVDIDKFIDDVTNNSQIYTPWVLEAVKILKKSRLNVLKDELRKFLESYEPYATAFYKRKIKETSKYSPIVSNFYKDLANFSQGGKKMRAFFVYLGYLVGGGRDVDKILQISLAFEMTQNFFLIHDDIMDNSDLRRGKPTIHKIYEKKHGPSISLRARRHYGESMAITLGDVAAIEAFKIIGDSGFSDKQKAICLSEFSKVLVETGYGQALDLEYSFEKADLSQILKIADLKAARYSVCGPLKIGASLAEASDVQKKALVQFGLNAGLAFQMQDDILGLFGEEVTIGKSVTSDMREGKNTVLIYKTKEAVSSADKEKIEKIWGKADASTKDLETIRGFAKKSGAFKWCNNENMRLITKAKKEIAKITKDDRLQIIFSQAADYIVSREN